MNEETMPYANVRSGEMDVENSAVRDQINQLLAGATSGKFITPYIALERVAKTLANFHIFIPSQHFLEGDSGTMMWPVSQYGNKIGMTNQGEFVVSGGTDKDETHGPHVGGEGSYIAATPEENEYTIYFEYRQSDCGMFMVFCELVSKDELAEILDDLEAEFDGDEGEDEADDDEGGLVVAEEKKAHDDPPFEPTGSTTNAKTPKNIAKTLARKAMKQAVKDKKVKQIDEVSKKTLASYVKKASHDVATKSAATGRYADRANRVKDEIKKGDYSNYQQGKKDDAFADKMFKKSWKRREGIAKATDKLAKD